MAVTGYHYSNDAFKDGDVLTAERDHFDFLDASLKAAELAIRSGTPEATEIRSRAIYVWRDEAWANHIFRFAKKKYLYEVEIEDDDVLHTADLNHFSDVKDAIARGNSTEEPVQRYWSGEPFVPGRHFKDQIEILARKITFRRLVSSA